MFQLDIKPKTGSIFSQHIKRLKRETDDFSTSTSKEEPSKISLIVKEKTSDGNIKETYVQGTSRKIGMLASYLFTKLLYLKSLSTVSKYSNRNEIMSQKVLKLCYN